MADIDISRNAFAVSGSVLAQTHSPLPLEQVRLGFVQVGGGCFPDAWVHEKTVPYAIIAIPLQGRYEVFCDGVYERIDTKEAFLTPPHSRLRITHRCSGRPPAMRSCWLHFAANAMETIELTDLLQMPLRLGRPLAHRFLALIEAMQELEATPMEAHRRSIRWNSLIWQALDLLLATCPMRPDARQILEGPGRLRPLLLYLRQHLAYEVRVEQMAKIAGMSVSHLHHSFRKQAGRGPLAHLKYLRLNEAACRLAGSGELVREISAAVGFANEFHFSREFRRQFGLSPIEYRQLHMQRDR